MSRKKKKRPLSPRTKRMDRKGRIQSARQWFTQQPRDHVVRAYCVRYGVDRVCALKELALLGMSVSAEAIAKAQKSVESKAEGRRRRRAAKATTQAEVAYEHPDFEFVAGYTSSGFPYGIPRGQNTSYPARTGPNHSLGPRRAPKERPPTPPSVQHSRTPVQGELFPSEATAAGPNRALQRTRCARR